MPTGSLKPRMSTSRLAEYALFYWPQSARDSNPLTRSFEHGSKPGSSAELHVASVQNTSSPSAVVRT